MSTRVGSRAGRGDGLRWLFILLLISVPLFLGCGRILPSSAETWVDEGVLFDPDTIGIAGALGISDCSIIQLADGRWRMFVSINTATTTAALYSASSTNGTNWTLEAGTRLPDITVSRPIKLSNGDYRLYYNAHDNGGILSALSTNEGWSFTTESGTRIATGDAHDRLAVDNGTTLLLSDGSFKLYYGGSNDNGAIIHFKILSATSNDGLTFTKDSGVRLTSAEDRVTHPHVFVYQGQYIMYYSTNSYIYKAVSTDGVTWSESGSTGIAGADPYVFQLSNGDWRMFYNTYDAATNKSYLRSALWRRL